jgi:Glu-tRNA(Gln) amidotransferase subunit E-like FAD-binding protein
MQQLEDQRGSLLEEVNKLRKENDLSEELAQANAEKSPLRHFQNFITQCMEDATLCANLTRHSPEELRTVAAEIKNDFLTHTTKGGVRKRNTQAPLKHSILESVFVTLLWLTQYPTDCVMAAMFALDVRDL